MPKGNPFASVNHARMYSNAITDQNQGGGDKKAGFPYQIGRDHWSSIYIGDRPQTGQCCKLKSIQKTLVFTRNTIRPINSDPRIAMR